MQAKLQAVTAAQREPIAIIGMGCRFPGEANSPETFWQLLEQGIDAVGEIPADRWDADAYYDPDPDAPGKMYAREAGFLSQVDGFDAPFFGISAREATSLDPQQRLLLEVSWEALEHANQAARAFNSTTGVFVGICSNDYNKMIWEAGGGASVDAFCATGNALSLAAGRISYALGLKGPSLSVDTACSSSLVAVHLACQHLRSGECDLAIASGVNLILAPETSIAFSKARMLDPSGRCKTFDANSSGYARGEGGGAVVLKRLSDAEQDGDHILAIIQGSAISHNGRSSSLVAPNGSSQQAVIRQAVDKSGIDPHQVGYVEVQGTGTAVGQSLEVGALTTVFRADANAKTPPLYVGTVKTNMGHSEGASGMASLMKVVLALQHQTIPPHLHFQAPNPYIDWETTPVRVPTEPVPWSAGAAVRTAGINSFGFSGTNAHVILTEPPTPSAPPPAQMERPLHLMTLSAKHPTSLQRLAEQFQEYLEADPDAAIADVCFSANTGRSHFQHRLAIAAASTQELSQQLAAFTQQQSSPTLWLGNVSHPPKVAIAFPGQSVAPNTGRKLYETQPVFRKAINRCSELLSAHLPMPLAQALYPNTTARATPENAPADALGPALSFALEYALYRLWRSWGLEPSILVGSGTGEIVAACAAGVFPLEAALKRAIDTDFIFDALSSPRYPIWSLAAGQWITERVAQASYWRSQPAPAEPQNASAALAQQEIAAVLVMGPHPIVAESPSDHPLWFASLQASAPWQTLLSSLATLYTIGVEVDWVGFDQPYARRSLPLPTYVWRHQRYWFDANGFGPPPQTTPARPLVPADTDTTSLIEALTATGDLSEAERALLPKLLSLLTQRATDESASTSSVPAASADEATTTFKTLTATDIQSWLVNRIAMELGVGPEEIDPQAEFDSYGLDSVLAISIASAGKQYLGVEVTPLMLIQHATITTLSNHLVAEFEASNTEVFEL
ncbi:MAG: acyltransferase domain-containing protein [Leptolyngbya sp. SIOISBB]|nr:acyltransferase domain-containing protein [Leptolyngbya sp. SIOISBB]